MFGSFPALYRELSWVKAPLSPVAIEKRGEAQVAPCRLFTGGLNLTEQRKLCPGASQPCTHISVMVSGRLAGMAVRPLPRQSTMPLLQVHMAGQEPDERVQVGTRVDSPWPAETVGVTSENITRPLPLQVCS